MKIYIPRRGSLARRFTVAAAALAVVALLLTALASFWLVKQQHQDAVQLLQQKEAEFNAAKLSETLHAISQHLSAVADNSILATALVDSAGKEAYLAPYLNSVRQIDGIPIQILFTDFEGAEIASNGLQNFSANELAWMRSRLQSGIEGSRIFEGARGADLVAVELLSYSRTASPEGALLYKIALSDLNRLITGTLQWREPARAAAENDGPPAIAIKAPPNFEALGFRVLAAAPVADSGGLAPPYFIVFVFTFSLAAAVLLLGSRLSLTLTRDLRRLEAFATGIVKDELGAQRAPLEGSNEVAGLARSINHMLDRLYDQHDQLQRESDKLKLLVNTIPHLAWMAHPDGWIHWYNDRWYEYTGKTPQQMEGWGWQSVHDPEQLPTVMERWNASIATGEPFELSFPLRGADGHYRTFFTRAAPLRDGAGNIVQWFGTNTDVSPLEQAEKAVRESEERLREGLSAARMAVWDWNLDSGKITFSANALQVFGDDTDSVDATWKWLHPDDVQPLRDLVAEAISHCGQYETVVRVKRPDTAGIVWLELRGKVECEASGRARSIRGIALDITERKRAEDELLAADRRKDEFLAMLAHELRNPLAPIRNAAHILKLIPSAEPRVKQTSEIISRQVEHMTGLVDDLLDVSRVTRGLVTLEKEPVEIHAVAAGALEQVRTLFEARHQQLTTQLLPEPQWVFGDKTRLVQIVANLLNNAAKFTPEEGHVCLSIGREDETVVIAVRDDGIGIGPDLLPHVFELFTQGERTPARSQGGLGLGLALVKSLVELHGGTVAGRSAGPGQGSEFILRLPRVAEPAAELAPSPGAQSSASAPAMTILVVDDNVDAADTLALLLSAEGHAVAVEYSARGGLARAARERPNVILLDIGLPDEDGYALARKLRAHPDTATARLIALTGYGQQEDRARSKAAGFDHHLVKPVDPSELSELLASVRTEG